MTPYREKVIAGCDKHNEIGPLEDGFQYFWPTVRGALSATDLRVIADELDHRNQDWEEQVATTEGLVDKRCENCRFALYHGRLDCICKLRGKPMGLEQSCEKWMP